MAIHYLTKLIKVIKQLMYKYEIYEAPERQNGQV
jgi:hypothetical protein